MDKDNDTTVFIAYKIKHITLVLLIETNSVEFL